jgi:TRAP-type C4-dicarboxylate transport system permease small subunit
MSEPLLHEEEEQARPRKLGPLFYIGAGGLLLAMTIEAIAVAGRQLSSPLLGALEIIQTAILFAASASMLSATLGNSHATVHLLTDRLAPMPKQWLQRFAHLLSALFFVALAAGALWLTIEFWHSHEESELLRIPFRPLRIVVFLAVSTIAVVFLYRAVLGTSQRRDA